MRVVGKGDRERVVPVLGRANEAPCRLAHRRRARGADAPALAVTERRGGRPAQPAGRPARPAGDLAGGEGARRPGRARRTASPPTCCAIRAPPTCSTTAPTSERCRSCSAMRRSARRRCTRRCRTNDWSRPGAPPTRAPGARLTTGIADGDRSARLRCGHVRGFCRPGFGAGRARAGAGDPARARCTSSIPRATTSSTTATSPIRPRSRPRWARTGCCTTSSAEISTTSRRPWPGWTKVRTARARCAATTSAPLGSRSCRRPGSVVDHA